MNTNEPRFKFNPESPLTTDTDHVRAFCIYHNLVDTSPNQTGHARLTAKGFDVFIQLMTCAAAEPEILQEALPTEAHWQMLQELREK